MHRALRHTEDPTESLLDQCWGVPDLDVDPGLLPGLAGPVGEDLRRQAVGRLVDEVSGQRGGLGQCQGAGQSRLPLGRVRKR